MQIKAPDVHAQIPFCLWISVVQPHKCPSLDWPESLCSVTYAWILIGLVNP